MPGWLVTNHLVSSPTMAVPRLGSVLLCKRIFGSSVGQNRGQFQNSGQKCGLATSSKLCDMFFTKKHEWVRVEGAKGRRKGATTQLKAIQGIASQQVYNVDQ